MVGSKTAAATSRTVLTLVFFALVTVILGAFLYGQEVRRTQVSSPQQTVQPRQDPLSGKQIRATSPPPDANRNSNSLPSPVEPLVEQVRTADLVLIGRVENVHSAFDNSRMYSYTSITPDRILKGAVVGSKAIVRTRGGVVGNVASYFSGQPHFRQGEEVFIMLRGPDAQQQYVVRGAILGAFHIETDAGLGNIAVIERGYDSVDSEVPMEPHLAEFLKRSRERLVTLDELLTSAGLAP